MEFTRNLFILFSIFGFLHINAQVVNQGTLYVTQGSTVSIENGLSNNSGATIHNDGYLLVQGDFVNEHQYNGNGSLEMGNHDTYTNLEMAGDTIAKLILSESDYTSLSHNIFVSDSIVFSGGDLLLSGFTLILSDTIGLRGHSNTSHIITNSRQIILSNFDNPDGIEIPIAYSPSVGYNPINISNSGAMDHFYIEMTDSVTEDGARNGTADKSSDIVAAMWMIRDSLNTAYSVDLSVSWAADEEGSSFDNTNAGLATYEGGSWNLNSSDLGDLSARSVSKTGITDIDKLAFAVGDGESDLISGLLFSLKVFLQGPYDAVNDNMSNSLNTAGLIPTLASDATVYGSTHSYSGSESFVTAPSSAVDWVLVELRDATSAATALNSTIVATVAGLLLQDGSITATDGSSDISFEGVSISNNVFVVIHHRNHLAVMSSAALTETGGVYTYDFTSSNTQAYEDKLIELEPGVYGLYAGDANADSDINTTDQNTYWRPNNGFNKTYNVSDFNMDTDVNTNDQNFYWRSNNGIVGSIPK